ncbi:MAG: hypothetical protein AAGE52_26525 [Myxococcota bacterium]
MQRSLMLAVFLVACGATTAEREFEEDYAERGRPCDPYVDHQPAPVPEDAARCGDGERGAHILACDTVQSRGCGTESMEPSQCCASVAEQCDGADLDGATCESLGFGDGTLGCGDCLYDLSRCHSCVSADATCSVPEVHPRRIVRWGSRVIALAEVEGAQQLIEIRVRDGRPSFEPMVTVSDDSRLAVGDGGLWLFRQQGQETIVDRVERRRVREDVHRIPCQVTTLLWSEQERWMVECNSTPRFRILDARWQLATPEEVQTANDAAGGRWTIVPEGNVPIRVGGEAIAVQPTPDRGPTTVWTRPSGDVSIHQERHRLFAGRAPLEINIGDVHVVAADASTRAPPFRGIARAQHVQPIDLPSGTLWWLRGTSYDANEDRRALLRGEETLGSDHGCQTIEPRVVGVRPTEFAWVPSARP